MPRPRILCFPVSAALGLVSAPMKSGLYVVMAIAVAFSWFKFIAAEKQLEVDKKAQIELRNSG